MSIGRLPRVRPLKRMKALIVEIATPVCALVRNDGYLPQNALTGAPGEAYLSTSQLPGHVPLLSSYPLTPTGAL